ncbi:MAG: ribose 5-phosphate isomerase B [Proteobacteria bacterium]|nr:ribose 5-phosphate isomerase B [Pseudomonadota bacterium]
MAKKLIALAADHAGFLMKEMVKDYLVGKGYDILDLGTDSAASVDYPDYGHAMGEVMDSGRAERGIVICGSGIGISMAANRHASVRAALCTNGLMARLARQHNDANVLALGARIVGEEVAKNCVDEFLSTEFEGGRHQRRVEKL